MYRHHLKVDSDTNEISILVNGNYAKWSKAKLMIRRSSENADLMAGQYSSIGVIDEGVYDWTTLKPFTKGKPVESLSVEHNDDTEESNDLLLHDTYYNGSGFPKSLIHNWGNRYLFEICCWIIDEPRLSGDHTWIRLKTPGICTVLSCFYLLFLFFP